MNTNRLSKTLESALNKQMTREAQASQLYLSYAAWASKQGYNGIANFLFRHAHEERNHMMKLLEFILNRGGEVKVSTIAAPPANPTNVLDCFEKIFSHEVDNTQTIYKVVKMSLDEEDWATWNFMQWFVKEQIEEETMAINLLDKVKLAGGEKMSSNTIYTFDRDLESMADEAKSATDVTVENP